jgi:hypothetical protein
MKMLPITQSVISDAKAKKEIRTYTYEVSKEELNAIVAMRSVEDLRNGNGIVGDIILEDGGLTVTRYIGGHHPQYAVYDGSQMICLCVYKRGAMALVEYINKMKGAVNSGGVE